MKPLIVSSLLCLMMPAGLVSCVKQPERKVVGPTSDTSKIPWNKPIPGQGGGQMGMLDQNRYRR